MQYWDHTLYRNARVKHRNDRVTYVQVQNSEIWERSEQRMCNSGEKW